MRRIEPWIDAAKIHERANEQRRHDEQHDAQSHLGADENAAQPRPRAAGNAARSALGQRGLHVEPAGLQRRHQTEQQTREQRQTHRERQHLPVERDVRPLVECRAAERLEPFEAHVADGQAKCPAHQPEHGALGHQLAQHITPAAAERHARRDFLRPAPAAHEHQHGEIHAGDEQHREHRAAQHHDRLLDVGNERVLQRHEREVSAETRHVVAGHSFDEPAVERGHRRDRCLPRAAVPDARDDPEVRAAAFAGARRPYRRPHIGGLAGILEALRHDADDVVALATQQQRLANGTGVAAEHALPQVVADHAHGRAARTVVVSGELAADRRRHAQHVEVARADARLTDRQRLAADDEIDVVAEATGDHRDVDGRRTVAHDLPRRAVVRLPPALALRRPALDLDHGQTFGLRIRQGAQQDRVRQAEHRGVRADDQRKRRDRGRRKRRRPSQHAHGVLEIAPQGIEERQPLHRLDLLQFRPRIAEGEPRFTLRVFRRAPARDQLFGE